MQSGAELVAGLNKEQAAAVCLPAEHALILAGAGSGKTRVLTTRMAWLILSGMASPAGVLAVTFTNKAAKEMLVRLTAMLPLNPRGLWVGTFHGLCNKMLRLHYREAGLPAAFAILDHQDQLAAVKRILKSHGIDDERYPPKTVQLYINGHKENGKRASDVESWDDYSRQLQRLYEAYERQCLREGVADFPELLLRCYELLKNSPVLLQHYQSRFRHILVDEFQDTNRLQYEWLKLLAGSGNTLFAVGDDDQSIYAFRGALVGNMYDFQREFDVSNVVRLEQNYRSQGNILNVANAIISSNRQRLGKHLWTEAPDGEKIRVFEMMTDLEEAETIVDEIRALVRDGLPASEIAILYRSNAQSRPIEHALFSSGMSYRVYGGLRFFERQEIKHALAYLRLVVNPADDNALLRIINFPVRGIGARTIEKLQTQAQEQGTSLWQVLCAGGGGRSATALVAFVQLIETLRQQAAGLPLPELCSVMLETTGLLAHYRADKDGDDRLSNLEELINAMTTFVAEDENDLTAFLAHASLEAGERQSGPDAEAVQLMTVHAAKGLEFRAVFVTGLEEGLFPHESSLLDPGALEEERRLMYVAVTRARERLYFTLAQSRMLHGQTRYAVASRFLGEAPQECLYYVNRGYAPAAVGSHASVVPPTPAASHAEHGLEVGMTVEHGRFGRGVITNCEGLGGGANVQVNFQEHGSKWLAVAYAKLKVIAH